MRRGSVIASTRPDARASAPSPLPVAGTVAHLLALLELARWENALIAAAGVVLGAWWASGMLTRATALVALAAVGLTALANAFNDLRDRAIDAVAHPTRPIPSGRATVADAIALATAGGVVAVVASALVSPALAVATVAVGALMLAYSVRLKAHGLVGNVVVALVASLPFVYGAWSVGAPERAAVLFALAVPLHFARELAKDLDDAAADAATRRTLPVTLGVARTRGVLTGALTVFAFVATALFVRGGLVAVALVLPALGCCAAAATRARAARAGAPRLLKAGMLLAMGAAIAARAGRLL